MSDLLQRLLNHSGELLIATDEAGAVVEVNAAGERLLGWTRDELLGRRLAELRHVDDREATGEWRLRRKDGGYRWFVWTANRSGGVTLHAGRDVTEERVVLDPLAPLLTLLAGLADFAAIVDPRGQVLHLNAAAQRFAGAEASETTLDQLTPNAARMIGEWIPRALSEGGWEGEAELTRVDGTTSTVTATIVPVRASGGRTLAALVARDHAEAARFEEELQRRFLQQEALSASTSTPIIQVWDDIVTMPVVGLVDSVRAADMKTALLELVSRTGARFAIVDLTGVDTVDTATADHLLKVMRAVQLLGARCVITGIQPSVAQIIVGLGLDLQDVITLRSLREGLRFCLRRLGFKIQKPTVSAALPGTA